MAKTVNKAPQASADTLKMTEDQIKSGNVLTDDQNADSDPLAVIAVNGSGTAVGHQVTLTSGARLSGNFTYDTAGAFDFLAVGQTGSDTISYTISDGPGGMAVGKINVVNDAPVAVHDTPRVGEDSGVTAIAVKGQ
jgi:large repetitive protein